MKVWRKKFKLMKDLCRKKGQTILILYGKKMKMVFPIIATAGNIYIRKQI